MDSLEPSILCVDDDPNVLDLLKEYFELQGFTVLTATDGVEAFLQVKQWRPQAIVMDLFMPRLGGIGALSRIKALNPHIVVILVSGMGNALDLVTEAGLAVAGALAKPLNFAKLSEMLARAGVTAPSALSVSAPGKRPVRARVLVVDDELEVRKMIGEHLRERGYEILEASDGEEALARVPEWQPQIVLLDIMMAGIGGMETLRRIKAAHPATCVIMVTAIEEIEPAHEALSLGASDYVTKPFTMQYLDSRVRAGSRGGGENSAELGALSGPVALVEPHCGHQDAGRFVAAEGEIRRLDGPAERARQHLVHADAECLESRADVAGHLAAGH
jgi:CheY-like chemotaxis protein